MKKLFVILLFLIVLTGLYIYINFGYEQPSYRVEKSFGKIEVRIYEPIIVARNKQKTNNDWDSTSKSFKVLANYIFGENQKKEKIGMTVPVIIEKIGDKMHMMFVMPKRYSIETLPKTDDEKIEIVQIPMRKIISITFRGNYYSDRQEKYLNDLLEFCKKNEMKLKDSNPIHVAYSNPMTTPPFMRKNEIWLELES